MEAVDNALSLSEAFATAHGSSFVLDDNTQKHLSIALPFILLQHGLANAPQSMHNRLVEMAVVWSQDVRDQNHVPCDCRTLPERVQSWMSAMDEMERDRSGPLPGLSQHSQSMGDTLVVLRAKHSTRWSDETFTRAALAAGAPEILSLAFAFLELVPSLLKLVGLEPWSENLTSALVLLVPAWRMRFMPFLERFPDAFAIALCRVHPRAAAQMILASMASYHVGAAARLAIRGLPESTMKLTLLARACAVARDATDDIVALAACSDIGLVVAALLACPFVPAFQTAWPRLRGR
jgi:hypothetical protein